MSRKKELKTTIKDELQRMLEATTDEPSEGRMKLLTLGIKYLAVEAKLEESEYGSFYEELDDGKSGSTGGVQKRERAKSGTRRDEGDDAGFLDSGEGILPS